MKHALSEASLPRGFRFAATACGLKKTGALDLAIISSDVPASAAAVFTQNLVVAPPVLVSKANLRASKGRMRGVVVNAGNANCATGAEGRAAAERTVAEAAKHVTCRPEELFVCSTGVIGVPLRGGQNPAPPAAAGASPAAVGALVRGVVAGHLHDRHARRRPPQHPSRWPASAFTWSAAPKARA